MVDDGLRSLIAVDPATGDRSSVSGPTRGYGPELAGGLSMDLDPVRGRMLVASLDALFAVDLASGDRTVLSDSTIGAGPALDCILGVAWDEATGCALLTVYHWDEIMTCLMAVEPVSGDRARINQ